MNQNNKFPRIIENRVRINIDFFCELSYNDFVANYFVIEKKQKIQVRPQQTDIDFYGYLEDILRRENES